MKSSGNIHPSNKGIITGLFLSFFLLSILLSGCLLNDDDDDCPEDDWTYLDAFEGDDWSISAMKIRYWTDIYENDYVDTTYYSNINGSIERCTIWYPGTGCLTTPTQTLNFLFPGFWEFHIGLIDFDGTAYTLRYPHYLGYGDCDIFNPNYSSCGTEIGENYIFTPNQIELRFFSYEDSGCDTGSSWRLVLTR
jgi:hypothetical protein